MAQVETKPITTEQPEPKRSWHGYFAWLISADRLALYFFLVGSFLIMYPLSAYMAVSANNEGDNLQQMWSMGWVIQKLGQNPFNYFTGDLFNANIFHPYPYTLAYSDPLLTQALMAIPFMLVNNNLVLSYHIVQWLAFALSGWGMYLLVKEITGSRLGGLVAGMVFAYAPYKIGRMSQLNLLSTQFIPFCFLFLRRAILSDVSSRASARSYQVLNYGGRRATGQGEISHKGSFNPLKNLPSLTKDIGVFVAFTVFFVLNAFASFYYFFFILPLLAIYLVALYLVKRRLPSWGFVVKLALSGLVAFLVMLPALLPYLQLSNDQSAERSTREVMQFSANYRFYLATTENNILWGDLLSRFGGSGGERKYFPGAIALLFAFIALISAILAFSRRRKSAPSSSIQHSSLIVHRADLWIWLGLGVFSLLMSFGLVLRAWGAEIAMPYQFFYDYVPGWKGLRAAMRYSLFVLLAVAMLAGFGVAWLAQFKLWRNKILAFGLSGLLLFGVFFEYRSEISYINPEILPNPPQVYKWLGEKGNEGAVLELPMPEPGNAFTIRNYYTTFNWQPYVGGQSGYTPPVYNDIFNLTKRFPDKEVISFLQGLEIRWIVFRLNDENTPISAGQWENLQKRIAAVKELKLVRTIPQDQTYVYELEQNGWLNRVLAPIPANAEVVVSDYRRTQPALIEIAATYLRKKGHNLYGNDRAGYRFLKPSAPGKPLEYALLAAQEDPAPYGFSAGEAITSENGITLYRRKNLPAVSYDLSRSEQLRQFSLLRSALELEIGKNEIKFNGNSSGSGKEQNEMILSLSLGSLEAQTIRLTAPNRPETTLRLSGGLNLWQSAKLKPGDKIRLEPEQGKSLYLTRAELLPTTTDSKEILTPVNSNNPALMDTRSRWENGKFVTTFNILTPALPSGTNGGYTFTLDIYRRPWGIHPNGHFGNYSVALQGSNRAHVVEFSFDPLSRQTTVNMDGSKADVGFELFKPGEGEWAVFIALWRPNAATPGADTQMGVARLYEFSLTENKLTEMNFLPERILVFQPPLTTN